VYEFWVVLERSDTCTTLRAEDAAESTRERVSVEREFLAFCVADPADRVLENVGLLVRAQPEHEQVDVSVGSSVLAPVARRAKTFGVVGTVGVTRRHYSV
jgi:hypothetical protein